MLVMIITMIICVAVQWAGGLVNNEAGRPRQHQATAALIHIALIVIDHRHYHQKMMVLIMIIYHNDHCHYDQHHANAVNVNDKFMP